MTTPARAACGKGSLRALRNHTRRLNLTKTMWQEFDFEQLA